MRRYPAKARLLLVLVLIVSAATFPSRASSPAGGTVTPLAPTVSWSGSFDSGGANVGGACASPTGQLAPLNASAATACDMYALDVTLPAGYWTDKTGAVTVTLDGFASDADVDLYIWQRTATGGFGSTVGSSFNAAGDAESFAIQKASGAYWVAAIGTTVNPGTTYNGSATLTSAPLPDPGPFVSAGPQVVIALIDSGMNPYHKAFRDTSDVAQRHPATYIPGYPKDAVALNLTLDAPDMATALAADAAVWANVKRGVLYYVPGTRIIGFMSVGGGGSRCGSLDFFPVNTATSLVNCPDRVLLDDHGHGTMTASRAAGAVAGNPHSLGGEARIVEIEGLGSGGVRWAADQGWIDVCSNSWTDLAPFPSNTLIDNTYTDIAYSAQKMLTFFATGNGIGGALGFAPNATYALATAPKGVILVGAHDNGKMTFWSGSPPHIVADGYGGWMAAKDSQDTYGPDSVACCTSAAAPYAAGGAARIILAARRILNSTQVGIAGGVVATGTPTAIGPLADGKLTMDEVRNVLFHTAEAAVTKDRDDGLLQWTGEPRTPDQLERGPAANPYCNGCNTLPIGWDQIPPGTPAYVLQGYGAINVRSTDLAIQVLMGNVAEPARADVDAFYSTDQSIREALSALS